MARPPKPERLRMDFDLRIPVTADQKRLITQAAEAEGVDMAAWARPILVRAAERRMARNGTTPRTPEIEKGEDG